MITLRPDRPYAYRAGQFASIETPYRPRSWRHYSMATAESPDGLLEFHVRTVGAGFVSGPLVWSAAVGDELKLGAPMGEMGIDKESQRDVLCIAGGTGLAPAQGDHRRDDALEHRAQGHAVLRRPPRGRPLRHARAAPHRCAEPLADDRPVRVRRPDLHRRARHPVRRGRTARQLDGPRRLPVRLARHDARDPVPAARDRGRRPSASPSTWPRTCTRRRHR